MTVTLGSGAYAYRVIENWAKLPDGWSFKEVGAVAVDRKDQVYVFNRGEHPMMVFDREGNFLRSWGEGVFPRAHGLHIGPDETLWCTDDGSHTVRHCTLDGKVLLEIGVPGKPAPYMSGVPFNRCTHTALSPAGDFYVSDGYGNSRVHKYAPKIKNNRRHLLLCFGSPCGRTGRSPSKVDNFAGGHHMATIGSSISRLVGRHLNRRRRRLYSFVGRLSPVPLQEFHVREARRQ